MLNRILCISLVLIPAICFPGWGDGIRMPKEALSIISLSLVVGAFLLLGKPIRKNIPLLCLAGWCIVITSFPMLTIPLGGDRVTINIPGQLIACKSLFYLLIGVLSILCLSSVRLDINKIFKCIYFVAIGLTIYSFIQLLGMDEFFRTADPGTGWVGQSVWFGVRNQVGDLSRRIVATLGNPSILGIFLAMILPIILYLKKYILFWGMAIVILLTLSATAYLGAVVGVLIYAFFTSRKMFISVICGCLILAGIGATQYNRVKFMVNPTGRIEVLKESFKLIDKKPLTGLGLGSFEYLVGLNREEVSKLNNENWREMHNEYGQAWFEVGFVGLILLLWTIYDGIKRRVFNLTHEAQAIFASLMVFLVASVTYFCFRISPISYYGVVLTGLFLNTGEDK